MLATMDALTTSVTPGTALRLAARILLLGERHATLFVLDLIARRRLALVVRNLRFDSRFGSGAFTSRQSGYGGRNYTPQAVIDGGVDVIGSDRQEILRAAKISMDGPSLLEFFRKRTLTPANRERIQSLIRQLGDKSFEVREQASAAELRQYLGKVEPGEGVPPFGSRRHHAPSAGAARR